MADKVEDGTQTIVDGTKSDVSGTVTPDPKLEVAVKAKEKLDELLETHGYDSLEDLSTAIQKSNDVATKLGEADLAEILEKASTLDRYNEYWAAEDVKKKSDEEPEDSVTRVEKKLDSFISGKEKEVSDKKALEESERVVTGFNDEITSFIKGQEEVPEEYRPLMGEFLGVKNPFNEVDITNKVAVRKMAKDGIKKIQDFEQVVIKRYMDGKIKIPDITKTEGAAPDTGKLNIKNLKEARSGMLESLTKHFMGNKSG